jgi:predicted transglutaminase-like cysteine proteinase
MSAIIRAQDAARWLLVLLSLGFVTAFAAVDADATVNNRIPVVANVSAGDAAAIPRAEHAPQPIVIASLATQTPLIDAVGAAPITAPRLHANIAPLISTTPMPAPTRYFTISEVLARHGDRAAHGTLQDNIQLASVDPSATPAEFGHNYSDEPFGLITFVAPDGLVWFKWRKVANDIHSAEPALLRCLADETTCSSAAARFVAIVKEAREHEGRVRLNLVNQRVNNAIRYTSDMTQWGTADEWSAPLAAGKGSFDTGLGDCEDYAIAKYVALRAAGVPAKQLRVLLVRDNIARLDHAVLAASEDGHWFILDNRWTAAVEDNDVRRFTPLFALDDEGVKLLAAPYASTAEARIEPMSEAVKGGKNENKSGAAQKILPGEEAAGQSPQFSQSAISALGLRGAVL